MFINITKLLWFDIIEVIFCKSSNEDIHNNS